MAAVVDRLAPAPMEIEAEWLTEARLDSTPPCDAMFIESRAFCGKPSVVRVAFACLNCPWHKHYFLCQAHYTALGNGRLPCVACLTTINSYEVK